MTPVEVADRLSEAASALRRLRVSGLWPQVWKSSWPDVVHAAGEAYGWDAAEAPRPPPTADEIDRLDEAMLWLVFIGSARQRKIVWSRAEGLSYRRIAAKVGLGRETVRRWHGAAILDISRALAGTKSGVSKNNLCQMGRLT